MFSSKKKYKQPSLERPGKENQDKYIQYCKKIGNCDKFSNIFLK